MNRTLQTFRYLIHGFSVMAVIAFISILASTAITNLIFQLTDARNPQPAVRQAVTLTVPAEYTAGIFALIVGMVLFLINFKVVLANGVSRKTFLLANLPAAAGLAAALSIFNLILVKVHGLFGPIILSSQLIYPGIGWAGVLLFQFAKYFLFIAAGWLISLAYYRSNVPGRWAISLAPFAVFGLYRVADVQSGRELSAALAAYWLATMRSDPLLAIASMLAYTAVLVGLVYLLLRRAPVR